MSRNIVPRVDKGADLGTQEKNWNRLYADIIFLGGNNLWTLLNSKVDLNTLIDKGDLYVATGLGTVIRFPAGEDGYVLKSNSGTPEGLMWGPAGARQELTGNITVYVGETGDYPTINAALESVVALYYPKYISGDNCPKVTINLLPGFIMNEQVSVKSLDLSWITITGYDEETIINRSALTKQITDDCCPAFISYNGGFLPIINQLFIMDTSGASGGRNGIVARYNSRAIVSPGCGVKNAAYYNIFASNGSIIDAPGANASGANQYGIFATQNSIINASGANVSGGGGISAKQNSIINASGANASGATGVSISASNNSLVNVSNANISNSRYGVVASNSSTINASNVDASGSIVIGFRVDYGSIINAPNAVGSLSQTANEITSNGIIFQ